MTADGPKMASRITTVSAWTAHALAWAPGVWLLFAPSYRGVSETILPDGSTEVTRHTATFVETNGLIVVSWLLVPVLLTYIALAATHFVEPGRANPGVSRNPSSHRRSCKRHPGGTVTRKSLLTDNTKRIRESPCLCRNDVEGPTSWDRRSRPAPLAK
jgi:hypothetical protein